MARLAAILGLTLCLGLAALRTAVAFDGATCCQLAVNKSRLIPHNGTIPEKPICGQKYNSHIPAAPDLFVTYKFCKTQCKGIQLSKATTPSQWAAPLVQFILPSVIFSMTIPRRKKIEFDYLFEFEWPKRVSRYFWIQEAVQLIVSMVCFAVLLIPVFIDTVLWITVIVVGAGNMLMGGLYEAHLDYRILGYIKTLSDVTNKEKLSMKTELLVAVACGNLDLEVERKRGAEHETPQETIVKSITIPGPGFPVDGHEKSRARLLNLLGAQSSFGGAVGSPVLFYLGAFIYTILDLLNDPSDQDSSNALGFGIEWMIIVHVAIVSGCLLAANNPSTSAGIVGCGHEVLDYRPPALRRAQSLHSTMRPDANMISYRAWDRKRIHHSLLGWSNAYETEFQPVSLWARGRNKMEWVKRSRAYRENHQGFKELMHITWWGWILKILLPALMLIVLPPATGGVVAYFTPPRGVGCRALSFIVYAVCQVATTVFALIRCAVDDGKRGPLLKHLFTGWRFNALSAIFWFGSLLAAVGGTTMQIVGIYRNCICAAGARYWWNINKANPPIQLASDTLEARNSSFSWISMGVVAMVFMALTTYTGWWYQRLIRRRFTDAVKEMYIPGDFESIEGVRPEWRGLGGGTGMSDMGSPLEHQNSATAPLLAQEDAETWGENTAKALRYSVSKPEQIRNISPLARESMESRPSYFGSALYDDRDGIGLSPLASPTITRKPLSQDYTMQYYQ